MDLTAEYIMMCKKLIGILPWNVEAGDFALNEGVWRDGIIIVNKIDDMPCPPGYYQAPEDYWASTFWLPRQDQLQEMIKDNYEFRNGKSWQMNLIKPFCDFTYQFRTFEAYSYEQLWLMFVMVLKFDKTWNGKDWS